MVAVTGDPSLKDRCVASSFLLREIARARGVAVDVRSGAAVVRHTRDWWKNLTGHLFCAHGDAIVDITASQFWRDASPVYVVPMGHARYVRVDERRNEPLWEMTSRTRAAHDTLREALALAAAAGDLGPESAAVPFHPPGARVELLVEHTPYRRELHELKPRALPPVPPGSLGTVLPTHGGGATVVSFDVTALPTPGMEAGDLPVVHCWCDPRSLRAVPAAVTSVRVRRPRRAPARISTPPTPPA